MILELAFCQPCEADAQGYQDHYLASAPITEGELLAAVVEQPVSALASFLHGDVYVGSVDRTIDLSLGPFDSGSWTCDSFECDVQCDVYEGNVLVVNEDGGWNADPDVFPLCEGRMTFHGTRTERAMHRPRLRRGTWSASDGVERPIAVALAGDSIQLVVPDGEGPNARLFSACGRLTTERSFSIESPTGAERTLSASGLVESSGNTQKRPVGNS